MSIILACFANKSKKNLTSKKALNTKQVKTNQGIELAIQHCTPLLAGCDVCGGNHDTEKCPELGLSVSRESPLQTK